MTENKITAIIGAGPTGLAAAAQLIERGETPAVFEAGPEPAWAVKQWDHVTLFSPWRFNIDKAAGRLLNRYGWNTPEMDKLPTGREFRERYLLTLASLPEMKTVIRLNSRITAVSRKHMDKVKNENRSSNPFILTVQESDGDEYLFEAESVIDCSGTWFNPNPLGSGGIPAPGERNLREFIRYGIPDVTNRDRSDYEDKVVAVVGSGHSAMHVVLDLLKLQKDNTGRTIHWIMRNTNLSKVFGGGEDDELEARGELGARARNAVENKQIVLHSPFMIQKIERCDNLNHNLTLIGEEHGNQRQVDVDRIIGTTGFRPDLGIIREVRTDIDPGLESVGELAPLIDPNIHSCGTVPPHGVNELKHPDEHFFIAGIKSYGRAPNFLLATGYEQVRSVAAYLSGNIEDANRTELNLPETGVCSTDFAVNSHSEDCCGGPVEEDESSCCVKDYNAKARGESGCGCTSTTAIE